MEIKFIANYKWFIGSIRATYARRYDYVCFVHVILMYTCGLRKKTGVPF